MVNNGPGSSADLQRLYDNYRGTPARSGASAGDHVANRPIYDAVALGETPGARPARACSSRDGTGRSPGLVRCVPREQVPEVRERQAGDRADAGV